MSELENYDVAIIGGGPAGLSAGIFLGRCRRRVILFDSGVPRNKLALAVNGFLGSEDISPSALRELGRQQAAKYGVNLVDSQVKRIDNPSQSGEGFKLTIANGLRIEARKVLLATGMKDEVPEIENINDFYGKCVHHCPYCDGWEHRDEHLVAVGDAKSAMELSMSLLTWSAHVTACTNGEAFSAKQEVKLTKAKIEFRSDVIKRLDGRDGQLQQVVFQHDPPLECDALFFSDSQYQHSELPSELGCECDSEGLVRTSDKQKTKIRGVFAAGDAGCDVQFAIVAAAQGATAAKSIHEELQKEDLDYLD